MVKESEEESGKKKVVLSKLTVWTYRHTAGRTKLSVKLD